jgi:catechol 2,3-dioxygenase-like lactoylglutathione lyase family enzyme
MAAVVGVGGVFLRCEDPAATAAWYERVLGLSQTAYGGFEFLHRESSARFPEGARTVFAPFEAGSGTFAPSDLPFMLNLIVDDLDGVLARAAAEGVRPVQPNEDHDYGRFAWILDPDGRKLELWQPTG